MPCLDGTGPPWAGGFWNCIAPLAGAGRNRGRMSGRGRGFSWRWAWNTLTQPPNPDYIIEDEERKALAEQVSFLQEQINHLNFQISELKGKNDK